jgi:hypothetical protein
MIRKVDPTAAHIALVIRAATCKYLVNLLNLKRSIILIRKGQYIKFNQCFYIKQKKLITLN